jgi:putative ABC transport system permease protein
MGTIILVCRLVARDLRRRPAQAALLLIAIAAASATLTLGLTLRTVSASPYLSTKTATAGPDVMAIEYGPPTAALTNLEHEPGVTGHSGPFPVAWPVMQAGGITQPVEAEGRSTAPAAIDQPKVTRGSWVNSGGVVVERAFADAIGVHVGDRITLNGRSFTVVGIAVTAAVSAYPNVCTVGCAFTKQYRAEISDAGLVWLTEPDARALATPAEPLSYRLNLTLKDPAAAPAFASAYTPSSAGPFLTPWQYIGQQDGLIVADEQQVLSTGGWLLGLLAIASVAVLAGGRMAEQARRTGLLKAAGATPGLVAVILLAENLLLALLAAALGLTAGWLAGPLLTSPGAGLLGSAGAPALTLSTAVEVALVACAVALAATFASAIRAASTSTTAALAGAGRSPRRGAVLIAISARLPVPLLLGLRLVARRRRRAVLTAASTAVTTMAITAVLTYHASSRQASGAAALANPVTGRLDQVMLVLTAAGIVLAAVNAVMTAWATALDARRSSALARALGATAAQVSAGLSAAQLAPALPGAVTGIPAGIGLFEVVNGGGVTAIPPIWWLAATVAGALTATALLTAVTARAAARSSAAKTLEETA